MTLLRSASGTYEGDFRYKGMPRLHLSLRTAKKPEAQRRHEAVAQLFRQRRHELLAQLRAGVLTVERLAAMVEHHEPLVPITAPAPTAAAPTSPWGTVQEEGDRYLAWIKSHPRKAVGTYNAARAQILRFQRFEYAGQRVGDLPLEDVPSLLIETYQRAFLDAQTPPNSITQYMGRVRALWRWLAAQEARRATEERRTPHPLYSPVDADMLVRETTPRDRTLDEDEAERLLAATPEPLLFPVAAALFGGFRLDEVLHLRRDLDVDRELGTLAVQRQPDWRPKTRRSARVVPIAEPLRPVLERQLVRYASARWLVPSLADLALPFNKRTFQQHFTAIVLRAGLVAGRTDPRGVTFHTLRHTFASWLVRRGVDLYTVAQLLGDTLAVVEATYAHLSPDVKRAAVAKLTGAIQLPTPSGLTEGLPEPPTEGLTEGSREGDQP